MLLEQAVSGGQSADCLEHIEVDDNGIRVSMGGKNYGVSDSCFLRFHASRADIADLKKIVDAYDELAGRCKNKSE